MQIFIYDLFFGAMLYMNYLQKGMMTMNTIGGGEKGGWERVRERERGEDVKCGKEIGFSGDF